MIRALKDRWQILERLFADERVFARAVVLVPVFYILIEFIAIAQFATQVSFDTTGLMPLWPIAWIGLFPGAAASAVYIFLPLFLVGASIGALFYRRRWARIVAFLSILQYQAFLISRLGSEHEFYLPLFVALIFVFLPDVWSRSPSGEDAKKFLLVYWCATAFVALVYFMSGLVKVIGAVQQWGGTTYFSFDSAALYVAYYLDLFQRQSLLGPFIIDYPIVGWLGLMLMLYVTLGGAAAIFRPALYPLWGLAYLLFHVSTLVSINLVFFFFPLFAAFFFLVSPFTPEGVKWREVLLQLPILGIVARLVLK